MTATLLDQFFAEECTPYVRRVIEEAIADTAVLRPHFALNRFEVTIERTADAVILEDVLDATEGGTQTVPLPQFIHALDHRSA